MSKRRMQNPYPDRNLGPGSGPRSVATPPMAAQWRAKVSSKVKTPPIAAQWRAKVSSKVKVTSRQYIALVTALRKKVKDALQSSFGSNRGPSSSLSYEDAQFSARQEKSSTRQPWYRPGPGNPKEENSSPSRPWYRSWALKVPFRNGGCGPGFLSGSTSGATSDIDSPPDRTFTEWDSVVSPEQREKDYWEAIYLLGRKDPSVREIVSCLQQANEKYEQLVKDICQHHEQNKITLTKATQKQIEDWFGTTRSDDSEGMAHINKSDVLNHYRVNYVAQMKECNKELVEEYHWKVLELTEKFPQYCETLYTLPFVQRMGPSKEDAYELYWRRDDPPLYLVETPSTDHIVSPMDPTERATESDLMIASYDPSASSSHPISGTLFSGRVQRVLIPVYYAELTGHVELHFNSTHELGGFLNRSLGDLYRSKLLLERVYEGVASKFECKRTDYLHNLLELQLHLMPYDYGGEPDVSSVKIADWIRLEAVGTGARPFIVARPKPRAENNPNELAKTGTQYDCSQDAIKRLQNLDTAIDELLSVQREEEQMENTLTGLQTKVAQLSAKGLEMQRQLNDISLQKSNELQMQENQGSLRTEKERRNESKNLQSQYIVLTAREKQLDKAIADADSKTKQIAWERDNLETQVRYLWPYTYIIKRMILERFRVRLYFEVEKLINDSSDSRHIYLDLPDPDDYFVKVDNLNLDMDKLKAKSSGGIYRKLIDQISQSKSLLKKLNLDRPSLDLTRFNLGDDNMTDQVMASSAAHLPPFDDLHVLADIACLNSGQKNWRRDSYHKIFRVAFGGNADCATMRANVFTNWGLRDRGRGAYTAAFRITPH